MRQIIRLTESELHGMIADMAVKALNEAFKSDKLRDFTKSHGGISKHSPVASEITDDMIGYSKEFGPGESCGIDCNSIDSPGYLLHGNDGSSLYLGLKDYHNDIKRSPMWGGGSEWYKNNEEGDRDHTRDVGNPNERNNSERNNDVSDPHTNPYRWETHRGYYGPYDSNEYENELSWKGYRK